MRRLSLSVMCNKKMKNCKISLDSNSVTYLKQASEHMEKPTGCLAEEQIALFRIFLFVEDIFYFTPTVMDEILAIPDSKNMNDHLEWIDVHFEKIKIDDVNATSRRATELQECHKGIKKYNDCAAIAESESNCCDYFLTYDSDLLKNLRQECRDLKLCSPSEFWNVLDILKGARPIKIPTSSNPLIGVNWWSW